MWSPLQSKSAVILTSFSSSNFLFHLLLPAKENSASKDLMCLDQAHPENLPFAIQGNITSSQERYRHIHGFPAPSEEGWLCKGEGHWGSFSEFCLPHSCRRNSTYEWHFSPSMGFLPVCNASDPSFQPPGDENFFPCVNLSLSMILPSWCSCYGFQTCYASPTFVSVISLEYIFCYLYLIGYTSLIELWLIHCLLRLW